MEPHTLELRDVLNEFISLCAAWNPGQRSDEIWDGLRENWLDFSETGSTVSECNMMLYEMVRDRLKSDGKIDDSMSETQIDWIIFTDTIIARSVKFTIQVYHNLHALNVIQWNDHVYVKLLEFPRFIGFNIRTNKRCLLAWIELFTVLLSAEMKKRADKNVKKKVTFESSKFSQQCRSILETIDAWNDKVVLKRSEFQIDLAQCIFSKLIECDSIGSGRPVFKNTCLEKIWTDRLWNLHDLQAEKGLDLSEEAQDHLEILTCRCPKSHLWKYIKSFCAKPVTEAEEKYLIQRRLNYEEMIRSKSKTDLPKPKRGSKAKAVREKKKCKTRARRQKLRMRASMHNFLFHRVFMAATDQTFTSLAHYAFKSQPKREKPVTDTITFKDWRNIDLLIQLIKIDARIEAKEAPIKEIKDMKKEDALAALRQLRNKLRRDPDYFGDL